MQFPVEGLGGKCVPEFAIGVGWSLPTEPQAETASHSEREFWDMLSGCKKGHMTWPSSYMCCGCSHEKPRLNTEASARAARNVRFIVSSARAGEHLMCSPCEQDCPSRRSNPAPIPASARGSVAYRWLMISSILPSSSIWSTVLGASRWLPLWTGSPQTVPSPSMTDRHMKGQRWSRVLLPSTRTRSTV